METSESARKGLCDYVVSSSDSEEEETDQEGYNESSEFKPENASSKKPADSADFHNTSQQSMKDEEEPNSTDFSNRGGMKREKRSRSRSRSPYRSRSRSRSRSTERRRDDRGRGRGRGRFYGSRRNYDRSRDDYRRPQNWDRNRDRRRDDRSYGGYRRDRDYDERRDYKREGDDRRNPSGRNFQQSREKKEAQQPKKKSFEETSSKLKEQIEKRKMLWQSNKDKKVADHWGAMLASCSDDKQAEKLKKLIGMKGQQGAPDSSSADPQNLATGASSGAPSSPETSQNVSKELTRKRQEELFRGLDQQYESARMSTHTHRGMGLGFSSQMNEYAAQIQMAQSAPATSAGQSSSGQ